MKPAPLLSTPLKLFSLAMILANVGSQMVFSLLPVYLTELGASVAEVGLVFSVASLVPLVLQIFGGWLSDSIGRLRTIAIGAIGGSLGYIGFVFAPSWEWALVAVCLEYISSALVGPSFGAFIAEQSTEETRGRVYGIVNMLYMIVGVVGPLLGGYVANRFGFKVMLISAAVLYVGAAVMRTWMAATMKTTGTAESSIVTLAGLRSKLGMMASLLVSGGVLTWIFITDGIRDIAVRLSTDLEPLYMTQIGGMSLEQLGWVRALGGLAMMLIALPAGWMSDRRGERVTIAFSFILQFAGLAIFVLATDFWSFALSAIVFGLGVGVITPAYDSFLSKAVPESMRGIAFGLFQTSLGVLSMPAPWLGGQLWNWAGPRAPFAINAIAALLATIPVWLKFKLPKKEPVVVTVEAK
jgi:MFS family permease